MYNDSKEIKRSKNYQPFYKTGKVYYHFSSFPYWSDNNWDGEYPHYVDEPIELDAVYYVKSRFYQGRGHINEVEYWILVSDFNPDDPTSEKNTFTIGYSDDRYSYHSDWYNEVFKTKEDAMATLHEEMQKVAVRIRKRIESLQEEVVELQIKTIPELQTILTQLSKEFVPS